MTKWIDDVLVLSTGKRVRALGGIIGVRRDFSLTYGHGGNIDMHELTSVEKIEMATAMIARWRQFIVASCLRGT
jgi:hypothetical protein